MDEQRLNQLFADAVGPPPAASFDARDVAAASRRATARRSGALAGGSLVAVTVLAGGIWLGGDVLRPDAGTPAAAPPPAPAPEPAPEPADRMLAPGQATPFLAPPGAGDGGTCAVDAEVGTALAQALDVAQPAIPLPGGCPPGARGAGVSVPGGTVYAVIGPRAAPTAPSVPVDDGVLTVFSVAADPATPAPRAGELDALAREVADRL